MAPYIAAPKFYELALDNGIMDAHEFFKNHREIGPFTAIARSATAGDDLERFIAKWQPGGTDFAVGYNAVASAEVTKNLTSAQASEIACLAANEKVGSLLHDGKIAKAAVIACAHNIVTPVSLASVLPNVNRTNYAAATDFGQNQVATAVLQGTAGEDPSSDQGASYSQRKYEEYSNYSPDIQGATNWTISPRSEDATFIAGVNTAGTVRVNNIANLEAMLNIIATGFELFGLIVGGAMAVKAVYSMIQRLPRERNGMTHSALLAYGIVTICGGLAVPATINWLVASARDANLFS